MRGRRILVGALLTLLFTSLPCAAEPPPFAVKAPDAELIGQLRKGGFVLYMRHGATDNSRSDQAPHVDLNDCSTQRPLTEAGRKTAAEVGAAIRRARIPVGKIIASPMCRTRESAAAAFKQEFTLDENLLYTANLTDEEKGPKIAALRQLLSTQQPEGSNLLLVAHAPNMMDVMNYFVKPEAAVVVIRPQGDGGFEYVATIAPEQWSSLLKPVAMER